MYGTNKTHEPLSLLMGKMPSFCLDQRIHSAQWEYVLNPEIKENSQTDNMYTGLTRHERLIPSNNT